MSKSHCLYSDYGSYFLVRTLSALSKEGNQTAEQPASACTALLCCPQTYNILPYLCIGRVADIERQALLAAAGQEVCTAEDACAPCGAALAGPSVILTFSYDYFEAAVLHSEFEVMLVLLRIPRLAQRNSTAVSSCLIALLILTGSSAGLAEMPASAHRRLLSESAHSRRWHRCCAH